MPQFGSLQNHLIGNSVSGQVPEVGMGVTRIFYSDREPYTIVEIINPKTIVVQEDDAIRTDDNGMSESQKYEFTRNTQKPKIVVTLRKNGQWIQKGQLKGGCVFKIGYRDKYYDFTF
jgi:hypothetical protein